jgi:DNA-binding transcriptional regulator YbjK
LIGERSTDATFLSGLVDDPLIMAPDRRRGGPAKSGNAEATRPHGPPPVTQRLLGAADRQTERVATEKGERRRAALVGAAAELLRAGGFDAVRHRAVAEKAGLPLASTTYYFGSLDDLVVAAVERSGRDELAEVRAGLDALPTDAAAPEVAELVLDQLLGPESRDSLEAVLLRYERFVGAGRRPYLGPLMREMRAEFDELLTAVLARAGWTLDRDALLRVVAIVDGTVVNSLIEADPEPRAAARAALLDILGRPGAPAT